MQSSDLSKTNGAHQLSLNDSTADVYSLRVSNICGLNPHWETIGCIFLKNIFLNCLLFIPYYCCIAILIKFFLTVFLLA